MSKFLSVIFSVMNTEKVFDPMKRNGSFEQLKDLSNVVGPHGIGFGFFNVEKYFLIQRENLKKDTQSKAVESEEHAGQSFLGSFSASVYGHFSTSS